MEPATALIVALQPDQTSHAPVASSHHAALSARTLIGALSFAFSASATTSWRQSLSCSLTVSQELAVTADATFVTGKAFWPTFYDLASCCSQAVTVAAAKVLASSLQWQRWWASWAGTVHLS